MFPPADRRDAHEELDRARSTEEYAANIVADPSWLGIAARLLPPVGIGSTLRGGQGSSCRQGVALYPYMRRWLRNEYACKRRLAQDSPPVYDRAALAD